MGNMVTVASVGFTLLRPDEYTLNYMESNPKEYPQSDPAKCAAKLKAYLVAEGKATSGVVYSPDSIQSWGCLTDQEIITLVRKFGTAESPDINMDLCN